MIDIKKFLPFILGAVLVLTLIITGTSYLTSTHSVKVEYSDARNVTVIEQKDGKKYTVGSISKSGNSLRLSNEGAFIIQYSGTEGFADGEVTIDNTTTNVDITPDYSVKKYNSLMKASLPTAIAVTTQKYPTAGSLYTITGAGMRERGKWFLIRLVHKGDYTYTSDDLKILLEKDGDSWKLRTKPDIILTQPSYPTVPLDILSWADKL